MLNLLLYMLVVCVCFCMFIFVFESSSEVLLPHLEREEDGHHVLGGLQEGAWQEHERRVRGAPSVLGVVGHACVGVGQPGLRSRGPHEAQLALESADLYDGDCGDGVDPP